jgi:uncharacterized protein YukE
MAKNGKSQELPENERPQEEVDLASEFTALGKKFADAVSTAWNSEERHNIQKELADGLNKLSAELNKASTNIRESDVGKKVENGVKQVGEDIKSGKVSEDVRQGLLKALRGLGDAIDRMADSFTPHDQDKPQE